MCSNATESRRNYLTAVIPNFQRNIGLGRKSAKVGYNSRSLSSKYIMLASIMKKYPITRYFSSTQHFTPLYRSNVHYKLSGECYQLTANRYHTM